MLPALFVLGLKYIFIILIIIQVFNLNFFFKQWQIKCKKCRILLFFSRMKGGDCPPPSPLSSILTIDYVLFIRVVLRVRTIFEITKRKTREAMHDLINFFVSSSFTALPNYIINEIFLLYPTKSEKKIHFFYVFINYYFLAKKFRSGIKKTSF